jgi:hypothetical protein
MIGTQILKHHIFFLSKCPPIGSWGVLNEKISILNVRYLNLIFKLHLLLNEICNARPLNPGHKLEFYLQRTFLLICIDILM